MGSPSDVEAQDELASAKSKDGGGATYMPDANRKPEPLEHERMIARVRAHELERTS